MFSHASHVESPSPAKLVVSSARPDPNPNTLLFVFFSGHGFSSGGRNYLFPDVRRRSLNNSTDAETKAVNAQSLFDFASSHAAASVMILDTHFDAVSDEDLASCSRSR
jgi:hypothetical protein